MAKAYSISDITDVILVLLFLLERKLSLRDWVKVSQNSKKDSMVGR